MNKNLSQLLGLAIIVGLAAAHRGHGMDGPGLAYGSNSTFPCVNAADNSTYNCSFAEWHNQTHALHNETADKSWLCVNATDNSTFNCSRDEWHAQMHNGSESHNHSNASFTCINATDNSTYNCSRDEWASQNGNGTRPCDGKGKGEDHKGGKDGKGPKAPPQAPPQGQNSGSAAQNQSSSGSSSSQFPQPPAGKQGGRGRKLLSAREGSDGESM